MSRVRYFQARKHEDEGLTTGCSNKVTSDLQGAGGKWGRGPQERMRQRNENTEYGWIIVEKLCSKAGA